MPGLLTVPGVVVAINGVVIVMYVGRPQSTQCLPLLMALMVLTVLAAFDSLDGPDTKHIAVAFSLYFIFNVASCRLQCHHHPSSVLRCL
jgi:hypothetical protein